MKDTGIKDIDGNEVFEGDFVCFPHIDKNKILVVVFVGDGDDMDWAADEKDGTPHRWLDSLCKKVG